MVDTAALDNILMQSEQMLSAAQAEDWDKLCDIEQQRRQAIAAFFVDRQTLSDTERQVLEKILSIDQTTEGISGQARDELGQNIRSMTKGQNVSKHYRETSRGGRY